MDDALNVPLEDEDLLVELALATALIVAANMHDGPLAKSEIDRILGVTDPTDQA